jgi:hypothetical protein
MDNKTYTPDESRDLYYYKNINKVYWVVNKDIYDCNNNIIFKNNDIVPCIYVENDNNILKILKFDYIIEHDKYKYTAWRKFIGTTYNIYVDVLLISNDNKLYNLKGDKVDFNDLKRSDILINKEYLAKFDYV